MFFGATAFSTANYDIFLYSQANNSGIESSITITVSSKFCDQVSRNFLTGTKSWTINDSGIESDCIAPTVTNVTSTKADGSYKAGTLIPITITFSEAVNVTGTPQITLETGGTDAVVDYSSGTGTNTLTFNYTVVAGHTSLDLNYVATNPLALNSGTIKDAALNAATLTLPAIGAAGSLAVNKDIVIDTTSPTVAITSTTTGVSDGSTTSDATINLTFTTSESTTDFVVGDITAGNGTLTDFTGSGTSYTATFTPTGQGACTIDVAGNTFTDGASNNNAAADQFNWTFDDVAPTVTNVTSTKANGTYSIDEIIAITITFSEAVNVTGTPQITLETGGTDAVVDYSSGTGTNTLTFNYTVVAGHTSLDLNYVATNPLALNSGTIKDAALNAATLTLPAIGAAGSLAVNKDMVIDTTVPTIAITSTTTGVSDGSTTSDATINLTFTTSESTTDFVVGDITAGNGTLTDFTGSGTSYTATFTPTGQGACTIDVAGNTFTDGASNNNAAADQFNWTFDDVAPTVTSVTSTKANGTYSIDEVIAITITFSEAVNVTGTPQITLETGGTDAVVDYSSGTGTNTLTFNYTVVAGHTSLDLNYVATNPLALNSGTIKDAALNVATLTLPAIGAAGSLAVNKDIVIDTTSPTIAITSTTTGVSDGSTTSDATINLTFTTSESTTDFVVGDITAGNGTLTDFTGSGTSYTATFTPTGQGACTIDVAGNTFTDGASNNNAAADQFNWTFDDVAPTVTSVTSTKANGTYSIDEIIAITITFSEAVNVTGTPQITLETGGTDAVVDYSSGTGTNTLTFNYTVVAGHTSLDLNYVATNPLALNSGTIKDAALNVATLTLPAIGAAGSLAVNKDIEIDTTSPTIAITSTTTGVSDGSTTSDATINLTFTTSESTTDFVVGDITAGNGTLTDFTGSGTSYTATFTPTGQGACTIDVAGNTFTDGASNNNAAADQFNWTFDDVAPTVTNVTSTKANGTYSIDEIIAITITFSEAVNVTGTPQITLETGGTDAVVDYSSGTGTNTLTFNYTVVAGHTSLDLNYVATNPLALNSGTIKDAALNVGTLTLPAIGAAGSLAVNKDIEIDTTSPTVAITSTTTGVSDGSTTSDATINLTFTTSTSTTDFTESDVTVSNGTLTDFTGSGT